MGEKTLTQGEVKKVMFNAIQLLDRCHSFARVSRHLVDPEGVGMLKDTLDLLERDLYLARGILEKFLNVDCNMERKEIKEIVRRMLARGETTRQISLIPKS